MVSCKRGTRLNDAEPEVRDKPSTGKSAMRPAYHYVFCRGIADRQNQGSLHNIVVQVLQ